MKYPDRKEYERTWREKNRDKYLESRRKYYKVHQNEIKEKMRNYYYAVHQPDRISNREKWKEIDRLWAQKRRQKFRELFLEIKEKMGNKCSSCGYNEYPQILHFHHLRNKTANVSEMKSFKKIREESAKCILLCPNCHMKITFVK